MIQTTMTLDTVEDNMTQDPENGDALSILVVDDSVEALQILETTLKKAGYSVWAVLSGEDALELVAERGLPQLALVDLHMPPGMDGFELCDRLNQFCDVPIMMLTAVDEAETVVHAIQQFAEDYVVKPFSPSELVARIRRVLERVGHFPYTAQMPLKVDRRLEIDFPARKLVKDGVTSTVTPTEARLLYILMRNSGKTVETDFLLRRMWPREITYEDRLHVYVHRLRAKLREVEGTHQYIVSERGVGYRFEPRPGTIG